MKSLITMITLLLISGCSFMQPEPRIETVYEEVKVPVSNVPMPPDTHCPEIAINTITKEEAKEDGLVVKAYRISVEQLKDCATLREKVIEKYREIAKEDAEKIDDFQNDNNDAGPLSSSGPSDNSEFEEIEAEFNELQNKKYDL